MGTSENRWSEEVLKETWSQMFSYSFYQNHYENLDVQCILMLLEGGLSHIKKFTELEELKGGMIIVLLDNRISVYNLYSDERMRRNIELGIAYSTLKATEKKLVAELEKKNDECLTLKRDMNRTSKPCVNCESLQVSLVEAKRRAKEADARIDSIANILRLAHQCEPSQAGNRNAAIDLVSQMILESSPPAKKKKSEIMSPEKLDILACDSADVLAEKKQENNGVIPATIQISPRKPIPPESPRPPRNKVRRVPRSPVISVNFIPTSRGGQSLSSSCDPLPSTSKSSNAEKNISADSVQRKHVSPKDISPVKTLVFDLTKGPPPLDDTLKEYVKESTGKLLDNIWFSDDEDDNSKKENVAKHGDEAARSSTEESPATAGVIAETPCVKSKKADFWLLREKRGPSEISKSSGRKMRQMKLELGFKKPERKVDLTQFVAGKRSLFDDVMDDDDIIVASPTGTQQTRTNVDTYLSQESEVNTTDFKPLAASTQMPKVPVKRSASSKALVNDFDRLPDKETNKEPDYAYARGAVKKKADRDKLEGWDCKNCAEYYSTMGKHLNPSEMKKRMNACSRHRNKFKPRLDETPPAFWNPLLPDTEQCKGYSSINEKPDC